jgi:nicotinate-nucleotide--dimethylbenzimidazole phosphoribosyltransferase
MSRKLVLVGGGVRSGKSAFALNCALRLGKRRVFVATGFGCDEEMRARIARHREQRGARFHTTEAGTDLARVIRGVRDADVVVIDCLTLFLSRCLMAGASESDADRAAVELVCSVRDAAAHVVIVTNEVGMGIVPASRMAMSQLERTCGRIRASSSAVAREVQARLDAKAKPLGSLGLLEFLATRYAALRRDAHPPRPQAAIVVLAADHGIAREGVSAYPQEVTAQMVRNFASGGAAANVLARWAHARLVVADFGTRAEQVPPPVLNRRVAHGTASFLERPAMTRDQTETAVLRGVAIAHDLAERGVGLIALGEMGIGNSTSAAALTAVLTGASTAEVTGRGTGVNDAILAHKRAVVQRAVARHRGARTDPLEMLAALGGFEIAGLVGVALGAAERRAGVVLDGFISTAAGLVAARLCPALRDYLFAGHCSQEPGHRIQLAALGLCPILDLSLRLGEGSGAALALPILDAAIALLSEMATFDSAGVARGHSGMASA